jgi:hypothetical protein
VLRVEIVNDGTEKELPEVVGHYNFTVYINDEIIAKGRLEDFNRLSGWQGLVSYFARTIEDKNYLIARTEGPGPCNCKENYTVTPQRNKLICNNCRRPRKQKNDAS